MTDFTRSQQVALAVVPKISSLLSLIGSTWIVVEVLTEEHNRKNVYNRILFAMSCIDILASMCFFASTWPIPQGTENIAFAAGTKTTCAIQAFFLQLNIAAPMYNCCLSLYYLLVIKYKITEERMKNNVEPAMHIFSFGFGLLSAVACLFMDLYHNANLWCWIAPPPDCLYEEEGYPYVETESIQYNRGTNNCLEGDDVHIYRWALYFGPLWICILFVTLIMTAIYCTVSRREADSFSKPVEIVRAASRRLMKTLSKRDSARRSSRFRHSFQVNASNTEDHEAAESENVDNVLQVLSTFVPASEQATSMRLYGVEAIYKQAFLYTLAFYVTFLFSTINRITQTVSGATYFPVILLHSFSIPLQGFSNLIVYRYYHYNRHKQRNPHLPFYTLLRWTFRWTFLGPPPEQNTESVERPRRISSQSSESGNDDEDDSRSKSVSEIVSMPHLHDDFETSMEISCDPSSELFHGGFQYPTMVTDLSPTDEIHFQY